MNAIWIFLLLCKKEFCFQKKDATHSLQRSNKRTILEINKLKSHSFFFLLFLPSYGSKILKRKLDSIQYMNTLNVL